MKKLVGFENDLGGEGKVAGAVGVEGADLVADVRVTYPIAKVAEPAFKVIDGVIDKLEQWIPGDQKMLAATLKAEAREELVKLLAEKPE